MHTRLRLNTRRETFARAVSIGKSHREAALAAGYSPHSAACLGSQLEKQPAVASRIRELRQGRMRTLQAGAELVARRLNIQRQDCKPAPVCDAHGVPIGLLIPDLWLNHEWN